jgi:peptidoglycan/LPS O-acetylase OafA/YrhL
MAGPFNREPPDGYIVLKRGSDSTIKPCNISQIQFCLSRGACFVISRMESLGILAGGLVMMLAVIATAAVIARHGKFYRREMAETGKRELALDGLRGMAALMVATHHAALSYTWLLTGQWGAARTPVLQLFGPGGVIIFFMLTGYLFWGKARAMNGKMDAWKLWRGRLFRIAPLYLFSVLLVLIVAAIDTGGHWLALKNWKPLLSLLALGASGWHNIGQINFLDYNAGVVWTLKYEWRFYLVLPFVAWFATGRKIFGVAIIYYILTIVCLWFNLNSQPGLFFILGMLCPVLLEDQKLRSQLCGPIAAGVTLLLTLFWCALNWNSMLANGVPPSVSIASALFPLFFVAAAGNSFFGFLTHPAIRCLGAMSFSLYLIHGIAFRLLFRMLKTDGLTDLPRLDYWLLIIATAIATTLLCAATYRWIEFPFLSASHKKRA